MHVLRPVEQEASRGSATPALPSSIEQQESMDHEPHNAGLPQGDTCSEAVTGAQKQDTGLQVQAVRNLSASSVEKPETPPQLTSPKSPRPDSSAVGDEAAKKDPVSDNSGSAPAKLEPAQQGSADNTEQNASGSPQESSGKGPYLGPTNHHCVAFLSTIRRRQMTDVLGLLRWVW